MPKSFEPVSSPDSRILILGSLPGVESLNQQQYYAYKHNKFWEIMGFLLKFDPFVSFATRYQHLLEARIALWDVVGSGTRPGSLDSNIKNEIANDVQSFFSSHREIGAVFFNGQTAAKMYRKHVFGDLSVENQNLHYHTLPSTSPANAAMNFAQKLQHWQIILDFLK